MGERAVDSRRLGRSRVPSGVVELSLLEKPARSIPLMKSNPRQPVGRSPQAVQVGAIPFLERVFQKYMDWLSVSVEKSEHRKANPRTINAGVSHLFDKNKGTI